MSDNNTAIKIDQNITAFSVKKADDDTTSVDKECCGKCDKEVVAEIIHMHEQLERPEMLMGSTYKIKTPLDEHAMYVTINDAVLNQGTEHEKRVPYEVFINSKNMEHFQWVVALTRVISAVFRKGGDVTFLVEELKSVFDPTGGFWDKQVFVSSVVAKIGMVIEQHLQMIGLMSVPELDEHQKKMIEDKKAEYLASQNIDTNTDDDKTTSLPGATLCTGCNEMAVIMMDGCNCCTSCGMSKCS
ncbi:MAG: NrdJb [Methylococcales bacterium]